MWHGDITRLLFFVANEETTATNSEMTATMMMDSEITAAMTMNSRSETTEAITINSETTTAMTMNSEALSTGVLAAIIAIFGLMILVVLITIVAVLVVYKIRTKHGTQSKAYHYKNINTATVTALNTQAKENMAYGHSMHNLKFKGTLIKLLKAGPGLAYV